MSLLTVAGYCFVCTTARNLPPRHLKSGVSNGVSRAGKPDQNAFIERFNRTYRNEFLDAHLFESIEQARLLTDEWLTIYNHERPHESLGRVPALMFMPRQTSGDSSYQVST